MTGKKGYSFTFWIRTILDAAQNIQNLTQSIIEELQKTKEEVSP
ncbi:hypothetical protein ADU37_CDS03040 [Thermococcus sp. 2319x1]|nr:hypothetical protein ADU37_CDS03040 [Thermococcus sp. 2319x1]